MQQVDEKLVECLRRFDEAIKVAEEAKDKLWRRRASEQLENYELLVTNLKKYRQAAVEGRLGRVSRGDRERGTGFGMRMFLSEWGCDDDAVLDACHAVEDYVRYEF